MGPWNMLVTMPMRQAAAMFYRIWALSFRGGRIVSSIAAFREKRKGGD